jgi:hypothetical protein
MARAYEEGNEWGDYTIEYGSTGFIVSYHSFRDDEVERRILVPYGTWGFNRDTELDAAYDEIATNGQLLAIRALDEAGLDVEERKVELIQAAPKPLARSGGVPFPYADAVAAVRRSETAGGGWDTGKWYTFSLKKEDELHYGHCHDMFTEMYLTHGLPAGMSLWDTSHHSAEENLFFVHVPEGVDTTGDELFQTFPLARCASPSKVGLSFMAGDMGEAATAESSRRRGTIWHRSAAHAPR